MVRTGRKLLTRVRQHVQTPRRCLIVSGRGLSFSEGNRLTNRCLAIHGNGMARNGHSSRTLAHLRAGRTLWLSTASESVRFYSAANLKQEQKVTRGNGTVAFGHRSLISDQTRASLLQWPMMVKMF